MHIRWKVFLLFLIALIWSSIITFAILKPDFWRQYSKFGEEDIRITATGEKNPEALYTQITIRYIEVDGKFFSPVDYVVEGNWEDTLNELTWIPENPEITNFIQLRLPPGHSRKLYFSKSIYRGYAQIDSRGNQYLVDFYDDGDINEAIDLSGYRNFNDMVLAILKGIFLIVCSLLLFAGLMLADKVLLKRLAAYKSADLICALLLLLFTLLCTLEHTNGPWSQIIPWTDSDVFIYFGWAMGKGKIPYVDIFDHKGLYFYFIEYLGYVLTNSPLGIWFIEFAAVYVSILFGYLLLRKYEGTVVSFIITVIGYSYTIFYLCYGNYIETYTIPLIAASIYMFHSYFYKQKFYMGNMRTFILGMLFCCTLMMRQNSIAVWPSVCLFIVLHQIYLKKPLEIFRYAFFFILGILIAGLPGIIYLTIHKAWSAFWEAYWLFNFSYVEGGGNRLEALGYFGLNVLCLIIYGGFICSVINYKKIARNFLMIICFMAAFSINVLFVCMAGDTWAHYGALLLPFYSVGLLILFQNIRIFVGDSKTKVFPLLVCYLGGVCTMILGMDQRNVFWLATQSTNLITYSPKYASARKVICRKIRQKTKEQDTITVLGNTCNYYWYSGRLSSSRYIYQDPLFRYSEDITEKYLEEIRQNKPSAIVIPNRENFEGFGDLYFEMSEILDQSYYLEYSQEGEELYLRNDL